MVPFRGINVNVVSQIDAQRLLEYSTAQSFDIHGRVAACYVSIQPGAQLWLEYALDGPHPDKAAYFFKLLIDGQVISSWDCTAKHEYCGKTVFFLHTTSLHTSGPTTILQRSLAFASVDGSKSPRVAGDCIEIRVHRIEHRRRVRNLPVDPAIPRTLRGQGALRIVDNGTIEPGRPARKYQYQLLDPQDQPYATFRFYCRTQDYLKRHQILDVDRSSLSTSLDTPSSSYFDAQSSPHEPQGKEPESRQYTPITPTKSPAYDKSIACNSDTNTTTARSPKKSLPPQYEVLPAIRIKGSIENLSSTVPRSPQPTKASPFRAKQDYIPPSPTRLSSPPVPEALKPLQVPKRRSPIKFVNHSDSPTLAQFLQDSTATPLPPLKFDNRNDPQLSTGSPPSIRPIHQRHRPSHLRLILDGSSSAPDPTLEAKDRRPLSPFTPSGLLRKISSASVLRSQRSLTPNMAAVVVPTVNEVDVVVKAKNNDKDDEIERGRDDKDGDAGPGTPASDKSEGTPRSMKQICSLWAAGRSGWTRRQKVEGGS